MNTKYVFVTGGVVSGLGKADFVGAGARLFGEYCFVIVLGVIKVCFPVVF